MERGEIWWATLAEPNGSEPGYRRPVLIIQSDDFNRSRIRTLIAVVLTSNVLLAAAPGNVMLRARATGLPKDSVANVSQMVTLDKEQLTDRVGRLRADDFKRIEDGIRLVLAL
jgi:mRNA interferase MazF